MVAVRRVVPGIAGTAKDSLSLLGSPLEVGGLDSSMSSEPDFSFCVFSGFLAICILLTSNNNMLHIVNWEYTKLFCVSVNSFIIYLENNILL